MEQIVQSLSGLPGFSNSIRTTGIRSKIWLMFGIIGLILTFIRIIAVTEEFLRDPILTQVGLKTASESSSFPAVTVCTLNQVSCAKAFQINELLEEAMKNKNILNQEQIRENLPKTCRLFKMAGCSTNCSDGGQFLNTSFEDLYDSLQHETKIAIGESLKTAMLEFKYANAVQNSSSWAIYYLPMTGNCFHFNYFGLVKEAGLGEENGIELLIRLNSDPNLREGIQDGKHGLTLTIQSPLAFPALTLNRIDLEPGMAHRIPLSRGSWTFLRNCISNWNDAAIQAFKNEKFMKAYGNFHYDQNVCNHYCQVEAIYNKCGCLSTSHEIPEARKHVFVEANGTIGRSCLSKDEECTSASIVADPEITCGCKLSCFEETFDMLPSQGKWPGDSSWKRIAKQFGFDRPIVNATDMTSFEDVDIEKYSDFLWRKKVDRSVMKIRIFLRTKESLEFKEKRKFETHWEVLAKMGGSMSVFMGLCFVAIIEVIGTYVVGFWSIISCQICKNGK